MQKNYFLHQSARDGFRSYLQAYASYSHKKIFDVNALDLSKVGKAFGFSVPPRVNLNIASSKVTNGKKRHRGEDEDEVKRLEELVPVPDEEEAGEYEGRTSNRQKERRRRVEIVGHKQVEKERFKKEKERKKLGGNRQWSR